MFEMAIEDVFSAPDGTVIVTGCISSGEVRPGDTLELCTPEKILQVEVVALEAFGRLSLAIEGDNIGVRLLGVRREAVSTGSRLVHR